MRKKRRMIGILILAVGAGTLLAAGIWWSIPLMPVVLRIIARVLFVIGAIVFLLHVHYGMLPYLKEDAETPDSEAVPRYFVASILLMVIAVVILYLAR
ncbi:MAG: hypothetical protein LIO86_10000 [Lachnospiraceae bacterium]|nr:hypothetical protein [Lachnospiraceae bacterium]